MKKVEEEPLLSGYAAYPTAQGSTPAPVTYFASDDHQPMDDQTKETIIYNLTNGFKKTYWIVFSVSAVIALAGIINLILYAALNLDEDTRTGLVISGSVLLGVGGTFDLIWLSIYCCLKRQQNSIANLFKSRNGLITEWIYTFDSDYQAYLKSEYGFTGEKTRKVIIFSILFIIIGIVAWMVTYFLHFDLIDDLPRLLATFLIWGLPYITVGILMIFVLVIVTCYRINEGFKPWKHSTILHSNGLVFYYGTPYLFQRHDAWLDTIAWNLMTASLKDRNWEGKTFSLMTLNIKRKSGRHVAHINLNIYIPPSLRNEAKNWITQVAQNYASHIFLNSGV